MIDLKKNSDDADMIVCGFAFKRQEGSRTGFYGEN